MKKVNVLYAAIFISLSVGCATTSSRLMPSDTTITTSPWKSYQEIKDVFDQVKPYRTTMADLKKLGLDPDLLPNTKFLDAVAVQNTFVNPGGGSDQKIPEEIRDCLSEFKQCRGFGFTYNQVVDRGVGNIVKRWLRFRIENLIRGPDVMFQVFLKGELVVFKRFEGTPNVDKTRLRKNPLGPLQEPFDLILKYTPTP